MRENNREVCLIQNPALGAALLWQFSCGYCNAVHQKTGVPFPLLFLVLPILFRSDLRDIIQCTYRSSGLQKIHEKLYSQHKADCFCSLQDSAIQYRPLTLESFNIALSAGLLSLSCENAYVTPHNISIKKVPSSCQLFLPLAEKFGYMCSSLNLYEISILLKVRF